jgi:hypothetical protein
MGDKSPKNKNKNQKQHNDAKAADQRNKQAAVAAKSANNPKKK